MTYDYSSLPIQQTNTRDFLEALWDLEDLHRELIRQVQALINHQGQTTVPRHADG